ncbi:MAG: type IV pilus assembly protein PilM, partial [Candidatus Wildermuthbacteria bacterium]|nr:type IV pilus assembly protein PilM [Candidatus Wildermuthbacteria bacterium]
MFFSKPAFGVDISDYSIEIVSLAGSIEKPKLLAMGRKVLEPGIFIDGKILDKERLKKTLRDLIGHLKFGKLGTKKIIASIPESKSYIRIVNLPAGIPKKETQEFVLSQAEENFPYSLGDLYLDFLICGNEALLAASPKNIIEDYLEIFRSCGLEPAVFEIESLSLGRSLLSSPERKNILIADIGDRTANFSVFKKGMLGMSFTLPVAGSKFTQALAEKLSISAASAESLKREIGLNSRYQDGKIFLILQKEIQPIVEEIKKIADYFRQKTNESVEGIILAGGSCALPDLPRYLNEKLALPVEICDPWDRI